MSIPLDPFAEGETVVRRDVFRGKVWTATPNRVIRDDDDRLVLACWPGVIGLAPTTWIEWLETGNERIRNQAGPNLAAGEWELARWTWRENARLRVYLGDSWFSVDLLFGPGHMLNRWSVNFEVPYRRTSIGVDTFDLFVDLVVQPDLSSYRWKDEREYAHARRLGVIPANVHERVRDAREQAVALVERREGPFAESWPERRVEGSWPIPTLHPRTLSVPVCD